MTKRMVLATLLAGGALLCLQAQNVEDDLYFTPSKKKEVKKEVKQVVTPKATTQSTVIVSSDAPATTTIVVRDRQGKRRDVDEYNRRYESRKYDFAQENDTL